MVVVAMVAVIMVLGAVIEGLLWDTATIDMVVVVEVLVIAVLTGVGIIVVGVIVIVFKFALSVSYAVDVSSSEVDVELLMDALAGVMLGDLPGIDVADVGADAFAVAITALEFPVPTPSEEFSR